MYCGRDCFQMDSLKTVKVFPFLGAFKEGRGDKEGKVKSSVSSNSKLFLSYIALPLNSRFKLNNMTHNLKCSQEYIHHGESYIITYGLEIIVSCVFPIFSYTYVLKSYAQVCLIISVSSDLIQKGQENLCNRSLEI